MPTLGQRLARADARRFVGRDRELGLLEAMLVDDPPASVAFVHGAAGSARARCCASSPAAPRATAATRG